MLTNFIDASLDSRVQELAANLSLKASREWRCEDEKEDLKLFHYNTAEQPREEHRAIRGLVYDSQAKVLVARSFPYTPTIISKKIIVEGETAVLEERTPKGERRTILPLDSFFLRRGYEGTLLRVFKHKGTVYHSSHRRLHTANSSWGASPSFLSIYEELGGPADEVLFDASKNYSPFCHIFLLAHPSLLMSSLQDIGPGYIVYLGPVKLWSEEEGKCPYPVEEVDAVLRTPQTIKSMPSKITQPFLLEPEEISVDQANLHLEKGWRNRGEFVILYFKNFQEGKMPSLLRICSPDYERRTLLRDNDPNLYHRWVEISHRAVSTDHRDFCRYYNCHPQAKLNHKYKALLRHYRSNLPLHMREECCHFDSNLIDDRHDLAYWLTGLVFEREENSLKGGRIPPRLLEILDLFQSKKSNKQEVYRKIDVLLIKENGSSLYKLFRAMWDVKKKKARDAQKASDEERLNEPKDLDLPNEPKILDLSDEPKIQNLPDEPKIQNLPDEPVEVRSSKPVESPTSKPVESRTSKPSQNLQRAYRPRKQKIKKEVSTGLETASSSSPTGLKTASSSSPTI